VRLSVMSLVGRFGLRRVIGKVMRACCINAYLGIVFRMPYRIIVSVTVVTVVMIAWCCAGICAGNGEGLGFVGFAGGT
jgi:hypothetical protein